MQWASSTATRDTGVRPRRVRNVSKPSRSGEANKSLTRPSNTSRATRLRWLALCVPLRQAADNPTSRARPTWSSIKEINGVTTKVSPESIMAGT
jgi:hypothetical protein